MKNIRKNITAMNVKKIEQGNWEKAEICIVHLWKKNYAINTSSRNLTTKYLIHLLKVPKKVISKILLFLYTKRWPCEPRLKRSFDFIVLSQMVVARDTPKSIRGNEWGGGLFDYDTAPSSTVTKDGNLYLRAAIEHWILKRMILFLFFMRRAKHTKRKERWLSIIVIYLTNKSKLRLLYVSWTDLRIEKWLWNIKSI